MINKYYLKRRNIGIRGTALKKLIELNYRSLAWGISESVVNI